MQGADELRLTVLGELTGSRGDVALDLGGRRQRAVLAALVIARGDAVPADRLADCVWREQPPSNPSGALQSYVSHLRRRLEPQATARNRDGVIAKVGPGYGLRLGLDAVDAWRFERAVMSAAHLQPADAAATLTGALRLWQGPAYSEYRDETWARAEIARLEELRAVARERLLQARLDLGESDLLVPDLEAALAENPLREERWRLLVLGLYRSQRQADALAALRRAREMLADELGVDPGPELRTLEHEVLAQSPALDAPVRRAAASAEHVAVPGPPPDPAATDEPAPPVDLVDREQERATLVAAVAAAAAGAGSVVLIEGPAGIGKTRLLLEAVRLADTAGLRVLTARCSQLEHSFGFGAVRQLFEPSVLASAGSRPVLEGPAASATGVFKQVAEDQRADGTFAVLHGLYWLTINLTASQPLLVSVDDVQWCDPASLRFLGYLVRRLEAVPVLVVASLRTGEAPADEDVLLGEIALEPAVTVLRPKPLSLAAATAVVRDRLDRAAEPFVAACHRTTAGNPLLLRQLVHALEADGIRPDAAHTDTVRAVGSRAIAGLVGLRLRRMPPDVTAAARAVAVLGAGADPAVVAELAGLTEERGAEALDLLVRTEILADQSLAAFVHPLVRDAVYDEIAPNERSLLHGRAAAVLRGHGADAEAVAAHLLRGPRRGNAATVVVLRDAARTALRRGASDSAVELFRRALDEPASDSERLDLLVELGMAETLVDGPSAVAHLAEAYERLDDAGTRAGVAIALARTHTFASPPGAASTFARAAAAELPGHLDDARQALLALQRTAGSMSGLPPSAYRDGDPPEIRGAGDGARMLAATLSYERLLDGEDRPGTIELARFALAGDRLLEVDNGLFWVFAATVLLVSDSDLDDSGRTAPRAGLAAFWERARQRSYATGSLFAALSANLWRGYFQWRSGRLGDALQSLADARDQNHMWGDSPVGAAYLAAFTAGVHVDRGDLDAARYVIDGARTLPHVGEGTRLLHESAARLLLAEDRPAEALDMVGAVTDHSRIRNPAWAPWRGLRARALAALGDGDGALALAEEEVALLRQWGAPSALGPSLRLLGELHTPGGVGLLREAVAVLSDGAEPVELARARLALAKAPGVPADEALRLLQDVTEGAGACGATVLLREATQALAARGATVAAAEVHPPAAMTARDRQILDLSAAGLGINEVAQRLLLTPGTVRSVLASGTSGVGA